MIFSAVSIGGWYSDYVMGGVFLGFDMILFFGPLSYRRWCYITG